MNFDIDGGWLAIGFLGQALFSARFFVQWLSSERIKKSVIPTAFWYFSVAGGATLLAYAIHRRDPVFIVGQASGLFIYLRNLQFLWRDRKAAAGGP
ncbi:MAG: lipid-A-disaccharide synthase N-terminal domain-containing protein [Burkholderiales bacterium]|nr:lipid-A-disaccharide synthase N-terminal domain-containing protein [Burkholderiales bacterium]